MAEDASRRRFLQGALGTAGALLLPSTMLGPSSGCGAVDAGMHAPDAGACPDPFAGGTLVGAVAFTGEGSPQLDHPIGSGLDGRLYHDLSTLDPSSLITPNDDFYIRTRYPDLIDPSQPWTISVHGLVAQPRTLTLDDLTPLVGDMGVHLMECSGNGAGAHFGMLSAARWSGAPLAKVLQLVDVLPQATRVLVSGFDMYSQPSATSVPGASWIFSFQQVTDFGGFLATAMNGVALPPDHGFPVRLLTPRWYGCTCIKWVNEIALVDDTAPATSQMQEYAGRTMQPGVPALAKDYLPASMDQAAMPVRVEMWRVDGRVAYRVVGVMWGGARPTDALQIRFNPDEAFVPVDVCPPQATNETWTLWTHRWEPAATGAYAIALHVADATVPQRRLDAGYYVRTVQIDEV
jgi:DMSO/TMAO reductase YedYZ molybdopterin-dependent catalytic subunit